MACVVILMAMIPGVSALIPADYPEPSYITEDLEVIEVDGDYNDWDLDNDFFANMYEAGISNHTHLADLYLRYNCSENKLYALVWAVNGTIDTNAGHDNHFIKIGQNDVYVNSSYPLSEFQFINEFNGQADGWEARIDLPEGYYSPDANGLNVHTQVFYDSGTQTARPSHNPTQIDLNIDCNNDNDNQIPEFPTIALPIMMILGLMFILQNRKRKED